MSLPVEQQFRHARLMSGGYQSASRFDNAFALWTPGNNAADAEILHGKDLLDGRSRDVSRNDAFVSAAIRTHRDSVVGPKFRLNAKPNYKLLGLTEEWAKEFSEEVEAHWDAWAESIYCWPDAARKMTFTELVRLAVGVFITNGEFLATVEFRSTEKERPLYTAINPIELNRLCNPQDRYPSGQDIRGGVRISSSGRPLGYYIRRREVGYTGAYGATFDNYKWSYVRAYARSSGPLALRPQVIHILDQERPGQTRGVSQLVAALKEIRMLRNFRDVTLQNAVLNASFAATVESDMPPEKAFESLGAVSGDAFTEAADKYLAALGEFSRSSENLKIDGVKIPYLYPGTKLNMRPAGEISGGVGLEFEQSFLRCMAASLDLSYEELSRDYSETTYSSARAALNQTAKSMRARKYSCADRFASITYRVWFEEIVGRRVLTTMNRVPNIYDNMNMEAYTSAQWIGASAGQIDELKETQAAIKRIESGLSTYEKECARFGDDFRHVFEQISRERARMDELGLEFTIGGPPLEQEAAEGGEAGAGEGNASNG